MRAVASGALLVAAFVIACANGAAPTDVVGDNDSGYLDVTRKEVEPVPPGDDQSTPPPPPPPPPMDDGGDDGGGGTGAVVINEVQTGGATASEEFIELYNPGTASVALSGWNLYYHAAGGGVGNGTTVHAFAAGDSIGAGGYFWIATASPFGGKTPNATYSASLAAAGGQVGLKDGAGKLVDAVGYGTATAGGPYVEGTAAPAPPASQSIARTPNGTDNNDNSADFKVATTPTPGAAN